MTLSPAWLDELRARTVLSAVIAPSVKLIRAGREWKACCPFHNEKTPSFWVSPAKQFFHCFGCGASGDVIEFVKRADTLTFPDAVRLLAARAGMTVPEPEDGKADADSAREREALLKVHEVATAWFKAQLNAPVGRAAHDRFKLRRRRLESVHLPVARDQRPPLRHHPDS